MDGGFFAGPDLLYSERGGTRSMPIFVYWLMAGVLTGYVTGRGMRTIKPGVLADIFLGLAGGFIGGYIIYYIGVGNPMYQFGGPAGSFFRLGFFLMTMASIVGAFILTAAVHAIMSGEDTMGAHVKPARPEYK
jgi:uncharacterized membrane protein YeaQ/YmgE (transglycosylase-associated protein family)